MKKIYSLFLVFLLGCSSTKLDFLTPLARNSIKTINSMYDKDKSDILKKVSKLNFLEPKWKNGFLINLEVVYGNGVRLEIIKKTNKKNKNAIYFAHGGAFLYPLSNIYRNLAQYMVEVNDNYDIIFVDYRQLPDYRYPTGNEDFNNGFEWVIKNYENVYAMGDSGGGNIVVSTTLKRRDEGKKLADALILLSPFLDISNTLDSRTRNRKTDLLIGNSSKDYVVPKLLSDNTYFSNYSNKKEPYISPVFGDFYNFPKTYIEVDKSEMLYDDSIILAEKLKNNNIEYELVEVEGLFHVYQLLPYTKEREKSIKRIFNFLEKIRNEKVL